MSRVIMPGQVTDEHAPDLVITLKLIDLVLGFCSWPAILYYVVLNRGKSLALKSMKKRRCHGSIDPYLRVEYSTTRPLGPPPSSENNCVFEQLALHSMHYITITFCSIQLRQFTVKQLLLINP